MVDARKRAYRQAKGKPRGNTTGTSKARRYNRPSYKGAAKRGEGIAAYGTKSEPVPRVLYTKSKYADDQNLAVTVLDTAVTHTYSLVTIHSPNVIGGHTTVGKSQLAQLYDQYWVMGAKVRVQFFDPNNDGVTVGCRLRLNGNDAVLGESLTQIKGKPLTYTSNISNSGSQRKTFSFYIKPWTLVGVSKLEYLANSSTYSSFMTSNPSAWQNAIMDVFATGDPGDAVKFAIEIEYNVKYYGRKALEASLI